MKTPSIKYDDSKHLYWINEIQVPSVTQILDVVTPKEALTWWGMRVGLAAVIRLCQTGKLAWPALANYSYADHLSGVPLEGEFVLNKRKVKKTPLEALIIQNKLSTNHIRDTRADEGTAIHHAIQKVGIEDTIPLITDFPPEFRGYIQAFSKWWLDHDPEFVEQEVIVAHAEELYAGRFDLRARLTGQLTTVDFKTSKSIYDDQFEQLRLYDVADRWLGQFVKDFEPSDKLAVVRLGVDGDYQMEFADHVCVETALNAIRLHRTRGEDKERKKAGKPAPIPLL